MGKTKTCAMCGIECDLNDFPITTSIFFPDRHSTICKDCLANIIEEAVSKNSDWSAFCRICQWLDYPFDVDKYIAIQHNYGRNAVIAYGQKFASKTHQDIDWQASQDHYLKLREATDNPVAGIETINDIQVRNLKDFWGNEYTNDELLYLERKYNNLNNTQHIQTEIQTDSAIKICKLSLMIDRMLREGDGEVNKLIKTYDSLVKIGGFTSENAKNGGDFDSMGEIGKYLEKKGMVNMFYDGQERDAIDALIKNIQIHNTRLFTHETGISEEITRRVEQLRECRRLENEPMAELGLNYQEESLIEYDGDEIFEEIIDE